MRDSMYDDTAVRMSLPPAVRSANATVNGTSVDMAGNRNNFRVAMMIVFAGAVTDGTHTVSLEESTDGTTGWAAVGAENREGSFPAITSATPNTIYKVGYNGNKRFIRASITTSGAPGSPVGGTVSAVILLAQGSGRPVS